MNVLNGRPSQPMSGTQRLFYELKVRHIANLFVAASILIVLGATLYPFDFTTEDFQKRLTPFLSPQWNNFPLIKDDVVTNIILFLPVGFGFAVLAHRKRLRKLTRFPLVVAGGALLSLIVEVLQLNLPFRFSSFIDVASNAAGAGFGFVMHSLLRRHIYAWLLKAIARANSGHTVGWLWATYAVYLSCTLLVSIPLQISSLLSEFEETTSPLVIGNESTGDRPWHGSIKNLIITRHAASQSEVREFLADGRLNPPDREVLLAHYEFRGRAPYSDIEKHSLPLEWKGAKVSRDSSDRAIVDSKHWLQTSKDVDQISDWIVLTRQMTICATIATRNTHQLENARIITVSENPNQTHFSLLQVGDDLVIRYRSMTTGINGTNPQFVVPNVFADTLMHRIVTTLDPTNINVYIDTPLHHYEAELGPGFALLYRFFPSSGRLDLSTRTRGLHNLLFYMLALVPLAYLIAQLMLQMRTWIWIRILVAGIGIVAPIYALERVLMNVTCREMNPEHFFVGLALMAGTIVFVLLSHLRHSIPDMQE